MVSYKDMCPLSSVPAPKTLGTSQVINKIGPSFVLIETPDRHLESINTGSEYQREKLCLEAGNFQLQFLTSRLGKVGRHLVSQLFVQNAIL